MNGAYTWRRPTLTRPIVSLPLALKRFTSGFGMGPGGSTSLWSPEVNSAYGAASLGTIVIIKLSRSLTSTWRLGFESRKEKILICSPW